MKSLILKDLYNIGHNAKSMLLILIVFAALFMTTSGTTEYIFISANLCGMMILTTFTFDDQSKWTRYAMIMPVSKKELIGGKFIVLFLFCVVGSLFGLVAGTIGGLLTKKVTLDAAGIAELLLVTLASWAIAVLFGSMSIPLVLKFGAEKGRVLMIASFLIPMAIFFGIYQLLIMAGVEMSEQLGVVVLCFSPLIALVWCYGMYCISYRIFDKKEF